MAPIYNVKKSEDEVGEKYDRCLTNTITNSFTGAGIGVLASLVLFGRKSWPVTFGGAFGLGMAFGNCRNEFRNIYPKQKPLSAVSEALTKDLETSVTVVAAETTPEVSEVATEAVISVVEAPESPVTTAPVEESSE